MQKTKAAASGGKFISKQKYTHVQALLTEIRTMITTGKTQREIAENFGLRDKYAVKRLLVCEHRKEKGPD